MDIEDIIEEKYTNWLNCETDELDLTIEEAKHILVNDHKQRYVDDLLEESWKTVLSELEKKEAIINEMVKQLAKLREKRRGRLFYKSTYKCMRNKI